MSDKTFLEKLNDRCIEHPHFDSRVKSRSDTTIDFECFQLRHYAGDVCPFLYLLLSYFMPPISITLLFYIICLLMHRTDTTEDDDIDFPLSIVYFPWTLLVRHVC